MKIEREKALATALENQSKYATYTYAARAAYDEECAENEAFAQYFASPAPDDFVCELYALDESGAYEKIVTKHASTPYEARVKALVEYVERNLEPDHHLDESARKQIVASKTIDPTRLNDWLAERGLNNAQAAALINANARTMRRWRTGKPPMPAATFNLLKIRAESL
jgi:DNA-binding transcriptional regulator YiaG